MARPRVCEKFGRPGESKKRVGVCVPAERVKCRWDIFEQRAGGEGVYFDCSSNGVVNRVGTFVAAPHVGKRAYEPFQDCLAGSRRSEDEKRNSLIVGHFFGRSR